MNKHKIAIGADHAAFELKAILIPFLEAKGHDVVDFGTDGPDSVDYPDFAHPICEAIESGAFQYGILLCGSGLGMSIAANRHIGIRAALVHDIEYASLARGHNDANVICIGARFVAPYHAQIIIDTFLNTGFDGGNHSRRLSKLAC
jgi:ribose 5-phosphate isomerase B